jgi:hypothetical protein
MDRRHHINQYSIGAGPAFLKFLYRHEIGHFLGLNDVSCAIGDSVMVPSGPTDGPYAQTTTCGDRKGLVRIYGDDGGGGGREPLPRCEFSPIVLSLDPGGVHLTDDWVLFDLLGAGTPIWTSWTRADTQDVWLVLDRDGSGGIESGRELFGTATPLGWSNSGPNARNGFEALRSLDDPTNGGDGDGIVTAADAVFAHLRLWRDANHNGISEPDELLPLLDVGVLAIDTQARISNRRDQFGNTFRWYSHFLYRDTNGVLHTRLLWDVMLAIR